MNNLYEWNLSELYIDNNEWEKEYEFLKEIMLSKIKRKIKIISSIEDIILIFELEDSIDENFNKLYMYCFLHMEIYGREKKYLDMIKKLENLWNDIYNIKMERNLIITNSYSLEELLKNHIITKYEKSLNEIYITEDEQYILNNRLLDKNEEINNKYYHIIKDIDVSDYNKIFISNDLKVIKKNLINYSRIFNNESEEIANLIKEKIFVWKSIQELNNYNNICDILIDEKEIKKIYNNILQSIKDNYNILHKYIELQCELSDKKIIHEHELKKVLFQLNKDDIVIEFSEAKEIIYNSMRIMGKNYCNIIDSAFNNGWIDPFQREKNLIILIV
ncbi:hypothetical protein KQI30_16570 [Clostridium bornimense]|uniref:hypothetical protein n=1 Tax=Clostridium bornimense TaxID=1216932 RepID=UPI001C0F5AC8|nr:hypothetical protein [Clostridium bornimense]MBU5317865.1 hypothetical protein [Clostridium bornimense]